jgi:hypothetical protein
MCWYNTEYAVSYIQTVPFFLPVTHLHQVRCASTPSQICYLFPLCFQVVKSRIQGAEKVPGVTPKYNWTYPALVTIAREEGFVALYKGFVPKVLRLAPGGGVLLLVVEFTLDVFRNGMRSPSYFRRL